MGSQSDLEYSYPSPPTMTPRIPVTNLFNAYDLQLNPLDEDKIRSQEAINYFEARFRVVLQAMLKRSDRDQKWMYKILFCEMVSLIARPLLAI
jgi:hypothetical protein